MLNAEPKEEYKNEPNIVEAHSSLDSDEDDLNAIYLNPACKYIILLHIAGTQNYIQQQLINKSDISSVGSAKKNYFRLMKDPDSSFSDSSNSENRDAIGVLSSHYIPKNYGISKSINF